MFSSQISPTISKFLHTNPGLMCLGSAHLIETQGLSSSTHPNTTLPAHQLRLLVRLFHVVTLIFLENSADFGDVLCFGERQHQEDPGFLRVQRIPGKHIGGDLAVKRHDAVMDA